uniref:Iron-sulfur cluster assembly enzyme n=1 Tax=Labrus bergylta TaxID=56723 RepID=A0A3Q3KXC1_9LABR
MAMVSLRNSASSLMLFSRRLFSPQLNALCSYHEKVVDHYENPRNVGSLDKSSRNVGTGLVGAPACGDVMKLQIQVDDNGKIVDAKFKTFGCGSAIASSSLATEWVKGKSCSQKTPSKQRCQTTELNSRTRRRTGQKLQINVFLCNKLSQPHDVIHHCNAVWKIGYRLHPVFGS